jgi:hypothetical protein
MEHFEDRGFIEQMVLAFRDDLLRGALSLGYRVGIGPADNDVAPPRLHVDPLAAAKTCSFNDIEREPNRQVFAPFAQDCRCQ